MISSLASILPSIGLFSVLCWPFLVGWLLWISRRVGHGYNLAIAGAVMTVGALCLFPSRLDILGKISVGLASILPFMLFQFTRYREEADKKADADRVTDFGEQARNERLPFLITGCIIMALSLFSALLASLFIGAGCVILAWWDGLSPRKAMAAWSMVRLRLCGVILAVMGAALLQIKATLPAGGMETSWALIFLVLGLGMMAGLGSLTGQKPSFALLDAGLRFAALCLMVRLGYYPLARNILLGAGLVGLVVSGVIQRRNEAFLPFLVALATIAASIQSLPAFLLLMAAGFCGIGLEQEEGFINWSVIFLVFVALLLMGQHLSPLYGGGMIVLAGLNFRSLAPVNFQGNFCVGLSGRNLFSSLKICLVPGVMVIVCLIAITLAGKPLPIGWHP